MQCSPAPCALVAGNDVVVGITSTPFDFSSAIVLFASLSIRILFSPKVKKFAGTNRASSWGMKVISNPNSRATFFSWSRFCLK